MHTPYHLCALIIHTRARHNPTPDRGSDRHPTEDQTEDQTAINKNKLAFIFFVDVRIALPYIQIIETNTKPITLGDNGSHLSF
jgi:hypothetical protein